MSWFGFDKKLTKNDIGKPITWVESLPIVDIGSSGQTLEIPSHRGILKSFGRDKLEGIQTVWTVAWIVEHPEVNEHNYWHFKATKKFYSRVYRNGKIIRIE